MFGSRSLAALVLIAALPASQTAAQVNVGDQRQRMPDPMQSDLATASQLLHSSLAQDQTQALQLFARAGQNGSIGGARMAAWMQLNGIGGPRDPKAAVEWLLWLAQNRDVWGYKTLGGCYRRGDGVAWNEAEAMRMYKVAASLSNDAEAESEIGRGYLNGFGPDTTDYPAAVSWFTPAVQQGYGPAELQLGWMYQRGWGVQQDRSIARQLYRRAERNPDAKVRQEAANLDQSLDRDQSASNDNAILLGLGVLAVAALASSSSSSESNQSSSSQGSQQNSSTYNDTQASKTCTIFYDVPITPDPTYPGTTTEQRSRVGHGYECP